MFRANLFNPFRSKPAQHEDHLTWAFLVALRYEPELQRYLRSTVLSELPHDRFVSSWRWEVADVQTQTTRIEAGASMVVSVALSDEPLHFPVPVKWVERSARYDGVIHFSDGLVIVLENKPSRDDVWEGQLSLSRDSAVDGWEGVDLYEQAVSLSWPDILEHLLEFQSSPFASFAGRQLVTDLLELVEETRGNLNPYRTFRLCGVVKEALRKRTAQLLHELAVAAGLETGTRKGMPFLRRPGCIAQEAQVLVGGSDEHPVLRQFLWPADTVSQARKFFSEVDENAFWDLSDRGWTIVPNLHFSFMSTQLVTATTTLPPKAYMALFRGGEEAYQQLNADEANLEPIMNRWLERQLITPSDFDEIIEQFVRTRRGHINVIPGFKLSYSWSVEDLCVLEEEGALLRRFREEYDAAVRTWGERF